MLRPCCALWIAAALLCGAAGQYSSDLCSWKGSGLSHESHRRDVEQVYLRCSQGSLEWLYPTGAVIVNLRPNVPPAHTAGLRACIRPLANSQGSNIYLEQAGELMLLLADKEHAQGSVHCFELAEGALFVEAAPATDISRRITAFQYELVPSKGPGGHMYPYLHPSGVTCEPCSDEEILMAVCTSDFAGVGTFQGAVPGGIRHSRVAVTLSRLLRQKSNLFTARGRRRWRGYINVPTRCTTSPGGDPLLLTGSVHFGEVWLGCAPRYKDFVRLYVRAQRAGTNPCQVNTDGLITSPVVKL